MKLLICLLIAFVPAIVGGLSTDVGDWYQQLNKPAWNPPAWIFGPVWTLLYASMGVALWLVIRCGLDKPGVKTALIAFAIQWALNLAWSPVFFGAKQIGLALIVIVLLWIAIGWTIARFWSVKDLAGAILIPYWLWVTFATALNATLWRMNG